MLFLSMSHHSFPFFNTRLEFRDLPSLPFLPSVWQFSRILDSISVLVLLIFPPLSSAFLPLSGISSWRFCHQFMLAEVQGCAGLASLHLFSFTTGSNNIPHFHYLPSLSHESHTDPGPSFYPSSFKTNLLSFS